MNEATLCPACQQGERFHDDLVVEGTPTVESSFDGQYSETSTRYRCTRCRALWEHLQEGGIRGNDSHWTLVSSR